VIAGVNGAGKSSVVGATIREMDGRYVNPDEEASALMARNRRLTQQAANALAWEMSRRGLERAIARQQDFTFETNLGGRTISRLLATAMDAGLEVVMRYVGLDSVDRHISRVRARVLLGGHDIPTSRIRERYRTSRENLIQLLPRLADLIVYDNSEERDPARGEAPAMVPLLRMVKGCIVFLAPREQISLWARPIVAAAILSHGERRCEG
jgi:predicted ABC-type ATPase